MEPAIEKKMEEFLDSVNDCLRSGPAKPRGKSTQCAVCSGYYPERIKDLTKGRCLECTLEIEFGVVPPLAPTSVGGGTPFYYTSDDEDPMLDNCTRIREGD